MEVGSIIGMPYCKHQFGLQGAGRLDALQDGDDAVRLDAETVEAGDQRFEIGAIEQGDRASGWSAWMSVKGSTAVSPFEKGSGWTTLGISVTRTVSVPWLIATARS